MVSALTGLNVNDFPHGYKVFKDVKKTEKLQESFVVMFVLFAFVEPTDESLKKTSIMKEREGEENGIKLILEFECNGMAREQLFLPSKCVLYFTI